MLSKFANIQYLRSPDLESMYNQYPLEIIPITTKLDELHELTKEITKTLTKLCINVDLSFATTYQHILDSNTCKSSVIKGHSGHRKAALKALKEASKWVIFVNPWTTNYGFDVEMLEAYISCFNRGVNISLGWGFQRDIGSLIIPGNGCWSFSRPNPWQYSAMGQLQKLRQQYPDKFRLKLIGTHAKLVACESFAAIGSCNVLCSKPRSEDDLYEELGLFTHNPSDIKVFLEWFEKAPNWAERKAG